MKDFIRIKDDGPMLISVETKPGENSINFVKTLFNNDWNFAIIAAGKPWVGFKSRIIYYLDYLKTIDDQKIVILSDSRDVFCLRSPEFFMHAFSSFNSNIVVGLEIFCQGRPDDLKAKEKKDRWQCEPLYNFWNNKKYKPRVGSFVNAGLISGRVKELIEYFNWVISEGFEDDQLSLGCYMNKFPDLVEADINNILFHNSGYGVNAGCSTNRQWIDSPNFAELTGRGSFFIHIPGIEGSTGQKRVYEFVKRCLIDDGINYKWFVKGYENSGWLNPGVTSFNRGFCD